MEESRLRVLLVDSDKVFRENLKIFLENNFDFQVETAANGSEVINRVQESLRDFDVAVIDQVLKPGVDGIQVVQLIRSKFPHIECIIFTEWDDNEKQRALEAGAFWHLKKSSLEYSELGTLIRTALHQIRLKAISRFILAKRDPEDVLLEIRKTACSLALADESAIALWDIDTQQVVIHANDYPKQQHWHRHFKHGYLTQDIIQSNTVVSIPNVEKDRRLHPKLVSSGIKSFVGVPIPGEKRNLGVLYVYSQRIDHFDSWDTISLLQSLSEQAGLAIANARAFKLTQTHASYMEALVHTGQKMTEISKFEYLLDLAWDFVREQLQVATFFIGLYNNHLNTLYFPMAYDKGKRVDLPDLKLEKKDFSQGISSYVLHTGQEVFWTTQDEKKKLCMQMGIRTYQVGDPCHSCFYLPLKEGNNIVGLISIQSYESHVFSEVLLNAFRALGSYLVVALAKNRMFEELQRSSDNLSALNSVVLEIGKEKEKTTLMDKILQKATHLLGAEGGGIYILDPNKEYLTLVFTVGLDLGMRGRRIHKSEGLSGEILSSMDAKQISEYHKWEKRLEILEGKKLTAVAGAPIRVGDQVLGTLIVHDTHPGRYFDKTLMGLLQQLASHAGLALQKTELLEKLHSIQQVATRINAALNLSEVFTYTCQAGLDLFGVDHSAIVLFDKDLVWGKVAGEYPTELKTVDLRIPLAGISAEKHIFKDRQPLVYTDVRTGMSDLGVVLKIWQDLDIQSILIVPLIYQDRVLGSFSLDVIGHQRAFTKEEIDLCKVFASHVSVAVENACLFLDAQNSRELLHSFFEASNALVFSKDLRQVLQDIVERARLASKADSVSMILMNLEGCVRTAITVGIDIPKDLDTIVRKDGLSVMVMKTGQPKIIENVNNHLEIVHPRMVQSKIAAALCLPVAQDGEILGVMWFHYTQPRSFSSGEIEAAQLYVNHVALAYDGARRIKELEYLRQTVEVLSGMGNQSETLYQIVCSSQEVLEADSAAIWVYNDMDDELIAEESVSVGISEDLWNDLRLRPQAGRLTSTIMRDGWLGITEVSKNDLIGENTKQNLMNQGIKSFQALALKVGEEKLGLLYVNYKNHRDFNAKDQQTAQTFANHAALALKNIHLLAVNDN